LRQTRGGSDRCDVGDRCVVEDERRDPGHARDRCDVGDLRVAEVERRDPSQTRDRCDVGYLCAAKIEVGDSRGCCDIHIKVRQRRDAFEVLKTEFRLPRLNRLFDPPRCFLDIVVVYHVVPRLLNMGFVRAKRNQIE
ncbi:MAG: hypothetical protein ACI85V_003455, partial [bacterium]